MPTNKDVSQRPEMILVIIALLYSILPAQLRADIVKGELIIEYKKQDRSGTTARMIGKSLQLEHQRDLASGRYGLFKLPSGRSYSRLSKGIRDHSLVKEVSPNIERTLTFTPNDPMYSPEQWSLHNTGQNISFPDPSDPFNDINLTGVPDADVDAPEAWDITTGSSDVIVAVIDTGYPVNVPELMANVWVNEDEIPGNNLDDDNNGYIDDVNGFDFFNDIGNVADSHGHGSFCSGIIGARGNDGTGMAGINWQIQIMALKSFSNEGTATDAELLDAIDYAVDNGARVINASWGDWLFSPALFSTIKRANDEGVLFVTSSGNDRAYLKDRPFYPACYTLPNILTVGATDIQDDWAAFSNFDPTYVHTHAPGYWVYSSRPSKYEFASGTSFATPHVVGVAALALAQDPLLDAETLKYRTISAVDELNSLEKRAIAPGRVSAYKVLTNHQNDSTPPESIDDLTVIGLSANGAEVEFTAPGDDGNLGTALFYDARLSTQTITLESFEYEQRLFHLPQPLESGIAQTFFATELDHDTTYYLAIKAYDEAGNASPSVPNLQFKTEASTIYFQDDMESGSDKWTVSGTFALTESASRSGNWCWTDSPDGDYERLKTTTITSEAIDLSSAIDPWLTFYHQHIFAESFTLAGDYGEVRISVDGENFVQVSQYLNQRSPFHMTRVNLHEYAGESTIYIQFRFRADFSLKVADGWYIDDILVSEINDFLPEPAEFVVESTDIFGNLNESADYSETTEGGNWFGSVGKAVLPEVRSQRSRYNVTTELGSTATVTPEFSTTGIYEVLVSWGDYANATNVRYQIDHALGSDEVYLTQDSRINKDTWHSLGTYLFAKGRNTNGSVIVDDSEVTGKPNGAAEGRVFIDSVRFVYLGSTFPSSQSGWFWY